jgi:hypothetical protein
MMSMLVLVNPPKGLVALAAVVGIVFGPNTDGTDKGELDGLLNTGITPVPHEEDGEGVGLLPQYDEAPLGEYSLGAVLGM